MSKVVGYVVIEKTLYINCHEIGIKTEDENCWAVSQYKPPPKLGESRGLQGRYLLDRHDKIRPVTKLDNLLAGIENAD